mgnify:CR=1 FL=1
MGFFVGMLQVVSLPKFPICCIIPFYTYHTKQICQKTLVGIGIFIYRKHSFIQRIIYFLTIYMLALKNIDINPYASQLKLTRKVPFLRVYNLLLIRMLKTSAKKVLSWASKGRYFDIKRASFQSQLSLNSSPNEHQ